MNGDPQQSEIVTIIASNTPIKANETQSGEFLIVPDGFVESSKGAFHLSPVSARETIANFNRKQRDLVVDFNHTSLEPSATGEAPAAGWLKTLTYRQGVGLVGVIKWLKRTRDLINQGAYRYLSPTVGIRPETGAVASLHSVALTNCPAILGAPSLTEFSETQRHGATSMSHMQANQEDGTVATAEQKVGELKALLESKGVKLGEAADFVSILNAAIGMISGDTSTAGDNEDTNMVAASEYARVCNDRTQLAHRLLRSQAQLSSHDTDGLVESYVRQGKLLVNHTEQMDWARTTAMSDPAGFKVIMDTAPVIVPQGRTIPPLGSPAEGRNSGRQSVILAAFNEWQRSGDDLRKMTDSVAFINLKLRDGDLDRMNESEAKQYA